MTSPAHHVTLALALCVGGAVLTAATERRWRRSTTWLGVGATGAVAWLMWTAAVRVLTAGPGPAVTLFALPGFGFALRLYVDGLSTVFLGLIATLALLASVYSVEYLEHPHYRDDERGHYWPHFLLFTAGMLGLVSTTDMMWFFFVFWQMMTLPGYALIRFEKSNPLHARAAGKFLALMQIACLATMAGAALLVGGRVTTPPGEVLMNADFDAVSHRLPALLLEQGGRVAVAFGLFLVGFGIKLGVWPWGQIWLPDAHPAAPSPVSALLSGVMIKTGLYGLLRYFVWLVPPESLEDYPALAWGVGLALLGTVTLLTGTVQALRQEQSKRLLAFSSIGQGGYLLFGLGVSLALLSVSKEAALALAGVALLGTLFHTLNHALFKSLLFFSAGSMLHATSTQNLNKLGGLLKFMPWTGLAALVACFSIAGAPLTNGFASKWHLYVAAIQGGTMVKVLPALALVAIGTSALTLAAFVKFFGVSFLSRTGRVVAEHAARRGSLEVGWRMRLPQAGLAAACVALGLCPAWAVQTITQALGHSRQGLATLLADALPKNAEAVSGLATVPAGAVLMPLALLAVGAGLFALAHGVSRLGGAGRRTEAPWLCGYAREHDQHRYSARHFYGEFSKWFRWLGPAPAPVEEDLKRT